MQSQIRNSVVLVIKYSFKDHAIAKQCHHHSNEGAGEHVVAVMMIAQYQSTRNIRREEKRRHHEYHSPEADTSLPTLNPQMREQIDCEVAETREYNFCMARGERLKGILDSGRISCT